MALCQQLRDIIERSNFMLKYTKFVSQVGQAFETIEVLRGLR